MEWIQEQFEKLDRSKTKLFKKSSNIGDLKSKALKKWMNCRKMCKCNVTNSWNDMANCLLCEIKKGETFVSPISAKIIH